MLNQMKTLSKRKEAVVKYTQVDKGIKYAGELWNYFLKIFDLLLKK